MLRNASMGRKLRVKISIGLAFYRMNITQNCNQRTKLIEMHRFIFIFTPHTLINKYFTYIRLLNVQTQTVALTGVSSKQSVLNPGAKQCFREIAHLLIFKQLQNCTMLNESSQKSPSMLLSS